MRPGNAGGGKDPDFQRAFEDGEGKVIGDEPYNTGKRSGPFRESCIVRRRRKAAAQRTLAARAFLSVCLTMKLVGKPDAGNRHVRFDERGQETECCHMAQATAPVLDSTRREFIALLGSAAAWPLAARAQQSGGRPLIGVLSPLSAATATRNIEGLRTGLRELGYVEGRNITLELRFAEGMPERMPALAAELVHLKPDVIIAAPETSCPPCAPSQVRFPSLRSGSKTRL